MKKFYKKAIIFAISLSLILQGGYLQNRNDHIAYAASNDYITSFTLDNMSKTNEAKNAVIKTGNEREYQVFLPDTAVGYQIYSNTAQYNSQPLYYQVEAPMNNGRSQKSNIAQIPNRSPKISNLSNTGINVNMLKVGATTTKKLTLGLYDSDNKIFAEGTTQEYTFCYFRQVMLEKLSAKADGEPLSLSPAFDTINEQNYAVQVLPTAKMVTLQLKAKTASATYDENDVITKAGTSLDFGTANSAVKTKTDGEVTDGEVTFEVSALPTDQDTGKKYIPITVDYLEPFTNDGVTTAHKSTNVKSSHYNLYINEFSYTPTVTSKGSQEVHYNRASEANSLCVQVDIDEKLKGEISYQWYQKEYPNVRFFPIANATEETYTPPTDHVRSTEYYCEVTNLYDGVRYTGQSNPVKVVIDATSASEPKIQVEPADITCVRGSMQTIKIEIDNTALDGNGEYNSEVSFQWYQCDSEGQNGVAIAEQTKNVFSVPTERIGAYYYYCVATNTVNGFSATKTSRVTTVKVQNVVGLEGLKGEGTENSPYQVQSLKDLNAIREAVKTGQLLEGIYFKMTSDIELPKDWEPIGCIKDQKNPDYIVKLPDGTTFVSEGGGANVNPFMGNFDGGNHTVKVAEGGLPLFNYVRKATIERLNIYGKEIASSALITTGFIDYGEDGKYSTGVPWTVKIDQVTLKEGSKTLKEGFLPGSGSGANVVTITNSTIEKDVIIGYGGNTGGGSFIGSLNGYIVNCISYATVNGTGGIAGHKGQSMGPCSIINCAFIGTLHSTGYAGGILGSGYNGYGSDGVNSAPNTPAVTIQNCYAVAEITGTGDMGGILGTEPSVECCWGNGDGTICNNYFKGTLTETSGKGNVGGIVGFLKSFDKYQGFDNNFYAKECGTKSGIGKIETIITKSHSKYGAAYGIDYEFDEQKVCIGMSGAAFNDNSLATKLNAGKYSTKNWMQGKKEGYPVLSKEPVVYQISLSGDYKTKYYTGETLDLENMIVTGTYTDGKTEVIPIEKVEFSQLDTGKAGDFEITVRYLAAEAKFKVQVRYKDPKPAKVSITILGDTAHGDPTEATGTHTLRSNNLPQQWYTGSFGVNQNSTVWDILQLVTNDTNGKISFSNPSGNYVDYVTYNGLKLGEFTNGKLSGWMYTLNGTHPNLGVSEQFLNPGDRIIFHYTDDYTKEEGSEKWNTPGADEVKNVTTSGAAGSATTTAPTEVKVSGTTATATIKAENQSEILKQAAEKKSAEIILEVSKADSKGADSVQLSLDVTFVKNVADKTDADLTVNTENGKVTLDQETIKTVLAEAKGATITLEVTKVSKPTEVQKKAAGANGHLLKLTIKSGDRVISDFNKGKVKVVAEIVSKLLDKKVAAIHIADDGKIEQLAGKVLTIGSKKYYKFTTPHFSTFALVDADELGLDVAEEPTVDAKALAAKLTPVARSAKTAKKNVKVTTSLDKQDKAIIQELKDAGYTVKYRFYRSTKKAAGYKAAVTKKTSTYTNTSGKKGTKYYYKVQVRVYDANAKLAAKTALKQCKYASRIWTR